MEVGIPGFTLDAERAVSRCFTSYFQTVARDLRTMAAAYVQSGLSAKAGKGFVKYSCA